ncbi:MAG: C39 family peptidase [Patescibacteria group bacterium]
MYSQWLDFKSKKRQATGCGILSLLMVMEYNKRNKKLPNPEKLYQVGLNRRAYVEKTGWRHSGLVGLAKLYGYKKSQAYDLTGQDFKPALIVLKKELKNGPLVVSIYKDYQPNKGGHLLVLEKLNETEALVWDPDTKNRNKVKQTIAIDKFLNGWKKRFITIR